MAWSPANWNFGKASTTSATTPAAGVQMTYDANGNPVTQQDANAILAQELTSWGFGHDAILWAAQQIQSNNSIDQILYSLRSQPFYKNSVFGRVADARAKANLPAMTESQILSYKDYAIGVAQQAGMPQGFITDDELVTLMGNDVSTAELDSRITQGFQAYAKTSPDVQAQLQTYYGITPGHAAAYFLDPTRALPLIQQQFLSAQIGAQATRTGYGAIAQPQALNLAQIGVTDATAQAGFEKLAHEQPLFTPLPGTAEQGITQQQQLGAEFGKNAQDEAVIAAAAQQRLAAFEGNYHFAETQNKGITGLGTVKRAGGNA